jgi:hypothetical protein
MDLMSNVESEADELRFQIWYVVKKSRDGPTTRAAVSQCGRLSLFHDIVVPPSVTRRADGAEGSDLMQWGLIPVQRT